MPKGGGNMATYVTLLTYTQKGIENIKDSPSRLDKAKEAIKSVGGQLRAFYMTMGAYDGLAIFEAPDDASFAKAILSIASKGAVKTQTMKAFTEEEYKRIIAALP
jgi:uncharacterized protein with GYD domain